MSGPTPKDRLVLRTSLVICLLIAAFAGTAFAAESPDPAAAGLEAYLEERYQDAVRSWRPLVESDRADGVLLYRFAYALDHSGGDETGVEAIRDRAREALALRLEEGGGPVECYYLGALQQDDTQAAGLLTGCFERFGHLAKGGDSDTLFFLARLAGAGEELTEERERLLREAVAGGLSTVGPRSLWLGSAARDLADLLRDSDRAEEALATYDEALAALPENLQLREARGDLLWHLDRNAEAEAAFRAVLEKDPGRGESWSGLGLALQDQGKCDQALPAFRKAIELLPRSATPQNGVGACLRQSDGTGAIAAFREAIRISPEWLSPRLNLIEALDDGGQPEAAEEEARSTIGKWPSSWKAQALLAGILSRKGDVEGALEVYRTAAGTISSPDLAWATMGQLLTEQGRPQEAIEPLRQAIAIDPDYGDWQRYLGSALEALKRYDEAESSYRKAIELEPEDAIHYGYLGSLLEDLGRNEESLEAFARAEELLPGYAFAVERSAIIKQRQGGAQAVVDYLGPRLERFSGNAPLLRRAGIAYDELGRVPEAESVLRQATSADPAYALGFDSLAIVHIRTGRRDEAIEVLEEGLRHQPDSATLNFRIGSVLDEAGRSEAAEPYLLRATELDPSLATAWNSLGVVRDHLGKTSEALAAFEQALARRKEFPLALMNLGRMHRKNGEVDEAIRAFRGVTEMEPRNTEAWGLLGEQLLKAGEPQLAHDAAASGVEADPNRQTSWNVLGDALMALDREEEALEAYRASERVEGDNDYPFQQEARILHRRQEYAAEVELLERYLERFPTSGFALRQKGLALYNMQLFPESLAAYHKAVELSGEDWIGWAGVGDASYKLNRLEDATEAYTRAVELNAEFAAGHAALGDVLAKRDRLVDAIAAYRVAVGLENRPDRVITLADLLRKNGQPEEARALLVEAVAAAAGSPEGESDAADLNRLRRALAGAYEATAQPSLAVPLLEKVVQASPKDVSVRRELAQALRGAGRLEESARLVEEALELDPDDQESLAMLKAFPHEIVDVEAILRKLRPEPLVIDPPDIDQIMGAFRKNDPDLAALIADESVASWDRYQLQVREGGLLTQTFHEIQWLLDTASAEQRGEYRISWAPSREQLEVHTARTHLPDGRVVDAAPDAYHRVAPADTSTGNVYSDAQILVISLPQIQPGAAIEVQYTKRMKTTLSDQNWWSSWLFHGAWPLLESRFVLRMPRGSPFRFDGNALAPKPEVREDESSTTYTWIGSRLPGIREESSSPSMNEERGLVRVTSYASWDELATWMQALMKGQFDLDEDAKREVARVIAGAEDPREKVRRLYDHLQKSIRYVAVELGISSYKPRRALETLRDGYGDCKDRGTLLIAMLRSAGIRALPSLVATRSRGGILHDAPSPGQFDHFIVYLPDLEAPDGEGKGSESRGVFVDATTEHNDFGILPTSDQGVEAFVIDDGKGTFIMTPVSRSETNRRRLDRSVKLLPDGTALITDDATAFGSFATRFRDTLARYDDQERKDLVHQSVREEFPAATDIEYQFTGVENPGGVPRDYETFKVEGFAQRVGRSSVVSFDILDTVEDLLPVSPVADRTMTYEADVPFVLEEKLSIRVEGGQSLLEWPDPVLLDSPHARLEISMTPGAGSPVTELVVEGRFTLKDRSIPLEDYAEFVSVVERTLSAGHLTVLLR